jgi:O-antigen/teichoic acid export membrane protein
MPKFFMSYTKKVAFNTIAQMVGKVASTGLSIVTVAMLFRYLGVDGVGKYTTVFAFVGFFSVFADFGLQWTLIRELTINQDKEKVFSNVFALRLILAAVVHLLAFGAVWLFPYPHDVKLGIGIITAAWFFTTINSVLVGVFLNNYRLDISVLAEFVGRLFIMAGIYFATKIGGSFMVVMTAYLLGNIVNFVFNLFAVRRFVDLKFAFDYQYWRHVVVQAVPIGLVLVFGFIYFKIDSLMLSLMKGMLDVGIYGTAYKLLEVLETVPSMFLGAAFPLLTSYVANKDERLNGAFQKQFNFLSLMAVPIVCGTFVLAAPIIDFVSGSKGSEFVGASTVTFLGHQATSITCLRILIFVVGISFFSNLYSYMIISLGKQKALILPTIGFALLNIVLNLFLIPNFSYIGASFATIITEIVVMTVYASTVSRYIRLPLKFDIFYRILISGAIMTIAINYFYLAGVNLFVNILAAMVIYAGSVLALKAVTIGELKGVFAKS